MNLFRKRATKWIFLFWVGISFSMFAKDDSLNETMVPFSIAELSSASGCVVHGIVEEISTKRDESRRIFTEINVKIMEVWKGNVPPGRLKVVQGGGSLGNERVDVTGQPQFAPGEEVILFLVKNKRGEFVIYAMSQGKFEVGEDNEKGKVVRNPFHGSSSQSNNKILGTNSWQGGDGLLSLESLKRQVKTAGSSSK